MKLAVMTGGGDAPGLNAVIRGVVRKATRLGDEVIGFYDGWRGVMNNEWMPLDVEGCRGYLTQGGTVLGTTRINPFAPTTGSTRSVRRSRRMASTHSSSSVVREP